MTDYITIADVDNEFGVDWTTADKKPLAVKQANAWLSAKKFCYDFDHTPNAIIEAGAYLARLSATDGLFITTSEGVVTEKRVKADSVEVQKKYAEGQETGKSADMQYIDVLLAPYLCKGLGGSARVCK